MLVILDEAFSPICSPAPFPTCILFSLVILPQFTSTVLSMHSLGPRMALPESTELSQGFAETQLEWKWAHRNNLQVGQKQRDTARDGHCHWQSQTQCFHCLPYKTCFTFHYARSVKWEAWRPQASSSAYFQCQVFPMTSRSPLGLQ